LRAQGDLSNDWLRNKTVVESDHTRIFRFDALTKRLTAMQVFVNTGDRDVLVFEVTGIEYNATLDPALFALQLPESTIWSVPADQMPVPAEGLPANPKEAAALLFDALSKEDWQRALSVYPDSEVQPAFKKTYAGLTVNSLGEPFQSGVYRGWFVPYEITLKSGLVKKHNLAVRNDNSKKRWVVDGGF
jgi:hypothetical protein